MRFPRFALLASMLLLASAASAQSVSPRFGIGFDVVAALPGQDIVPDGVGVGLRGRVAMPVNADLSVSADLGISANLFEGRSDYLLNPQASLIVTLPGSSSARYVLGGFGGFIPFDGGGGPSLHLGFGWAVPLNETSIYFELDPSLVVGSEETGVVISARTGVIF